MAKLFSVNSEMQIESRIDLDNEFVIRSDDFISIEINGGFNWHQHASNCPDCKKFIDDFGLNTYRWLLDYEDDLFILDLREFEVNDHFKNLSQFIISKEFHGTKLKFKKWGFTDDSLRQLILLHENLEEYENCGELLNISKYINNKSS